jgi:hypothetical protein
MTLKQRLKTTPLVGPVLQRVRRALRGAPEPFRDSDSYWKQRYERGGNSGAGSYDKMAEFKAQFLNEFVRDENIASVIEHGCGDGNQLTLAEYPTYLGLDVSPKAISMCEELFADDPSKQFRLAADRSGDSADLSLSLDVIYHLIEDHVFNEYMSTLFDSAERFVIVFSSNTDETPEEFPAHVRHRKFSAWIEANRPDWELIRHVPNIHPYTGDHLTGSFADFYVYARVNDTSS